MVQKLSEKQLELMQVARERRATKESTPITGPTTLQKIASGLGAVGKEIGGAGLSGAAQGVMAIPAIPREVSDITSKHVSPFVAKQLGLGELRPGTSLLEQAGAPSFQEIERFARKVSPEPIREGLFFEPETFPGRTIQRGTRAAVPALLGGPGAAAVAGGAGVLGQTTEEGLELLGVQPEQAQIAGTAVEVITDLFGVPRALASKVVKEGAGEVPTAAALQAKSSKSFAKARELGGVLKPEKFDDFIDDAIDSVRPKTEIGVALAGDTPTTDKLKALEQFRGEPLTLDAATEVDTLLGKEISRHFITDPGEAHDLMEIQNSLRKMIDKAGELDVIGGKDGFKAIKEARKLWSRQAKLRDIELIIDNAMRRPNSTEALRSGFDTLFRNKKRMRGFSQIERKAIETAANTGAMGDVLRTFGSRLIGVGGAVTAAPTTAAALATGSALSRKGASALQAQRAAQARELVARGGPLAEFLQVPPVSQGAGIVPRVATGAARAAAALPRAGVRALAGQRGLQAIPIAQQRAGVLGAEIMQRLRGTQ